MTVQELVDKYLQCKEKISDLEATIAPQLKALKQAMDLIEVKLLEQLNEAGVESMKTVAGTAYKSRRTSASVADWDMFLDFVRQNEAWEFLEKRANKSSVEQFRASNDDIPPGVNIREEVVVNIRRSN